MTGYTKLFGSIVTSTIWQEDNCTRIVWITLLALVGKGGIVEGSIPGLAHMARVPLPDCEAALLKLKSPDAYSRTKDFEGRRIEEIPGGWRILNHAKYRGMMSSEERRAYKTAWQRNRREFESEVVEHEASGQQEFDESTLSTNGLSGHIPEADTDTEALLPLGTGIVRKKSTAFVRPTIEEMIAHGQQIKLPENEAEGCFYFYESKGWKVGRNPMVNWKAAMANWKRTWIAGGCRAAMSHRESGQQQKFIC